MTATSAPNPIKVLQVVGSMEMGGIETSLMHFFRNMDRQHYQIDLLYTAPRGESAYDKEIRQLGINIFPCSKWRPWSFGRDFRKILRAHGPYEVVHSHLYRFNGYILKLADAEGVPLCIAHSHNDAPPYSGLLGRQYQKLAQKWIDRHANLKLAVSRKAAASLYGSNWQKDPLVKIIHQGRDFSPFQTPVDREAIRRQLALPQEALVLGHVGRFHAQKNHAFLLKITAEVIKRHPDTRLLLIGEGELKKRIEAQAKALGLFEKIIFAGLRDDVPQLLLGAMDVFVLPSLYEGLPSVAVEAQAAGLPTVISDAISDEIDLVPQLLTRLSLGRPAEEWAQAILNASRKAPEIKRAEALSIIRKSDLTIQRYVQNFEAVYRRSRPEAAALSSLKSPAPGTLKLAKPVRVLEVVGNMSIGGIETVLMNFLRNLDNRRLQIDFLYVNPQRKSLYDLELQRRGCRIFYCSKRRLWSFGSKFRKILHDSGPYDILHSHLFRFNGYILKLAHACGVATRIAHSHSAAPPYRGLFLQLYQRLQKRWIWQYATHGLAISKAAATALFGPGWEDDRRFRLVYCGIPLEPFRQEVNPETVRQELGIPEGAFVVGHVGRFQAVKNHRFLLEIFSEIIRRHPQACLLLVGDGGLMASTKAKAAALGIRDKVIFTEVRFDVPRLMLGAMDTFVFPSLYEGLSNSLAEAQAAGLPCVISDSIPDEVDIVKPLITRLSLTQPAGKWATAALDTYREGPRISRNSALAIMQESYLNMDNYIKTIAEIYLQKNTPPAPARPGHES